MTNTIITNQAIIRVLLGIIVAWQVKQETGWWTFFFVLVVLVSSELEGINNRLRDIRTDSIQGYMEEKEKRKSGFQQRLEDALEEQRRVRERINNTKK